MNKSLFLSFWENLREDTDVEQKVIRAVLAAWRLESKSISSVSSWWFKKPEGPWRSMKVRRVFIGIWRSDWVNFGCSEGEKYQVMILLRKIRGITAFDFSFLG